MTQEWAESIHNLNQAIRYLKTKLQSDMRYHKEMRTRGQDNITVYTKDTRQVSARHGYHLAVTFSASLAVTPCM